LFAAIGRITTQHIRENQQKNFPICEQFFDPQESGQSNCPTTCVTTLGTALETIFPTSAHLWVSRWTAAISKPHLPSACLVSAMAGAARWPAGPHAPPAAGGTAPCGASRPPGGQSLGRHEDPGHPWGFVPTCKTSSGSAVWGWSTRTGGQGRIASRTQTSGQIPHRSGAYDVVCVWVGKSLRSSQL